MTLELLLAIIVVVALLALLALIPRWHRRSEEYDGELIVVGYDEITGNPDLTLIITRDPVDLVGKRSIRLKMVDETN